MDREGRQRRHTEAMGQERRLYPIGVQTFEKIRSGSYLYIDKTELIHELIMNGTVYFLSRPRRFGKSLLVTTLEAYFSGRRDLFLGLAMERLEEEWAEYPVLHFDFSGTKYFSEADLDEQLDLMLSRMERVYGSDSGEVSYAGRLSGIIRRAYVKTGRPRSCSWWTSTTPLCWTAPETPVFRRSCGTGSGASTAW